MYFFLVTASVVCVYYRFVSIVVRYTRAYTLKSQSHLTLNYRNVCLYFHSILTATTHTHTQPYTSSSSYPNQPNALQQQQKKPEKNKGENKATKKWHLAV